MTIINYDFYFLNENSYILDVFHFFLFKILFLFLINEHVFFCFFLL